MEQQIIMFMRNQMIGIAPYCCRIKKKKQSSSRSKQERQQPMQLLIDVNHYLKRHRPQLIVEIARRDMRLASRRSRRRYVTYIEEQSVPGRPIDRLRTAAKDIPDFRSQHAANTEGHSAVYKHHLTLKWQAIQGW
eukprot:6184625-Pleurochrysis_carterae.AAC.2